MDRNLMPSTEIGGTVKTQLFHGEDPLFEMQEAADYIRRSKSTMEKYSSKNLIPKYRPNNGKVLFKKSDLDNFINAFRLKSSYELEMEAMNTIKNLRHD